MGIESLERGFFRLERRGAIATLVVNRPESRNAMTSAMWRDLAPVMNSLGEDDGVKVIVLKGEGKTFIAGADIKEFQEIAGDPDKSRQYLLWVEGAMSSVEAIEKPVIALVNGPAIGGGCELCVACDLRYAAEGAQLGIPACRLGIVITFQDTQRLVRLVGPAFAREMLMAGRIYTAREALGIGLVNGVFPPEELEGFVYKLAEEMSGYAPLTLKAAKRFTLASFETPRPSNPKEGTARSLAAFLSGDFREGVRAYIEKRTPRFSGK